MEIDIAEQICLAVDQIIAKRLEDIKYDTTIIGTIADNTESSQYRYTCSNGSSNFIAYSKDTTYKIGDSVQITIPNGDYDQQKIIIGKYVAKENDKPYVFIQPFDTIIDISSNLINNNINTIYGSLLANDEYDIKNEFFNKEIHLWTGVFDTPQIGFNRLGLAGQFRTWISSFKPVSGDFGYRLEIFSENAEIVGAEKVSIRDWIDLYGRALNGEKNLNEAGLLDNTPESWYKKVMPKEDFIAEFKDVEKRVNLIKLMLYTNAQVSFWELESKDMYGNPYNFQSYFSQENVFDISDVEPIVGMTLFFYETSNTFFNEENKPIIYKDALGNKLPPNLFTKDPYICLGYDLEGFKQEEAILYTMNSKGYKFEGNPETDENKILNKKTVRLRWLHEFDNGDIHVINDDTNIGNFEVRWYKYKLGSPSADEYSGVYWERMENDSESVFDFSFIPAYNLAQEQIKAIILYNGNIIRSNILTFNNELEVPNGSTAELLAGLSIWCEDNSYGNYYRYGQNDDYMESENDSYKRKRTFEARFADRDLILSEADVDKTATELTEGQKIIWEFPLNNSMIIVDGFNYNYKRDAEEYLEQAKKYLEENPDYAENFLDKSENLWYNIIAEQYKERLFKLDGYYNNGEKIRVENGLIKIIRIGEDNKIEAHQDYRIEKTYAATKVNNTVKCSVDKNGYTYSGSKELSFGLMGTNGADVTLVIDFNNNVSALTADVTESVEVTARLYDQSHNEVDFQNIDLNLTCEWSWANYLQPFEGNALVTIEDQNLNTCHLSHNAGLPMNEKGLFMILQAKIKGWGNYDLVAYKAIPVRATRNYRYILGPTEVIYNSAGYVDYYKGPYELYYAKSVTEYDTVPSNIEVVKQDSKWSIFDPYWTGDRENKYIGKITNKNILQPATMYFSDVDPYGAICQVDNQIVWIQPLIVMQNIYPSSTLNKWDGKSIQINDKEGYIISPAIAAGKKNSDNTFSGVMIGDWANKDATLGGTAEEITKQTGIYGFEHGAMSYAFKEDGTAFIGKDGRGRIMFDGNDATIYSATYDAGEGMKIDLGGDNRSPFIDIQAAGSNILLKAEEGASYMKFTSGTSQIVIDSGSKGYPYIKIQSGSGTSKILLSAQDKGSEIEFKGSGSNDRITISSDADKNPLEIGTRFKVSWEGNLTANNAILKNMYASGEIAGNLGVIGGWCISGQTLQGGKTTFNDDGTYSWKSNAQRSIEEKIFIPDIYLDAPNAAICGGRLKPSLDGSKMEVWGSFEICDSTGKTVTDNVGNYLGYVTSGMPDENGDPTEAPGIGLVLEGVAAVKATKDNIGLQYFDGGFISISKASVNITAANNNPLALYGNNIWIGLKDVTKHVIFGQSFDMSNIPAEKQKGIYARFA